MFDYTNSEPPDYELLPNSMDEIFYLYLHFSNSYRDGYQETLRRYYFPNIDGMKGEKILINWICRYIGLLFLRQYTLRRYLSIDKPLDLPQIPETQSEKKIWLDHLDVFKKQVLELLDNENLKDSIGINYLNENWFEKNDKIKPDKFFSDLKIEIEKEYVKREQEQDISPNKLQKFKDSSGDILSDAIDEIKTLFTEQKYDESKEYESWYTRDYTSILSRTAFLDDVDAL